MNENVILKEDAIINRIYRMSDTKVMKYRCLSKIHGVETKRLKEAVKRNLKRFPDDFMFQLTTIEMNNWTSQIVISNREKMGLRKAPYAFTEQGVVMLSSVLKSDTAIAVNIQIVRVFTKMRKVINSNIEMLLKIEQLEKSMMQHNAQVQQNTGDLQTVFQALKALLEKKTERRKRIGFKPD